MGVELLTKTLTNREAFISGVLDEMTVARLELVNALVNKLIEMFAHPNDLVTVETNKDVISNPLMQEIE